MSELTVSRGKLIKSATILSVLSVLVIVYFFNVNESTDIDFAESADQSRHQSAGEKQPIPAAYQQATTPGINTSEGDSYIDMTKQHRDDQAIANSARTEQTQASNLLSLDDEALISLHDVLENSFVPVFSQSADMDNSLEQQSAIDILLSRLPENMSNEAFLQLNVLMKDYLPYDLADSLTEQIQTQYMIDARQQAYLQHQGQVDTMAQQVAMAEHLQKMAATNDTSGSKNQAVSAELAEWQAFEKVLQNKGDESEGDSRIRALITETYDQRVAGDYIELSEIESQWLQRYALYQAEKQVIVQSGLSQADKTEQIDDLIKQHYEEKEWAAVRGYDELMASQADQDG